MNVAVNELNNSLPENNGLGQYSAAELEQLTRKYPYFMPGRLLYLRKLSEDSSPALDEELRNTELWLPNTPWLEQLFMQDATEPGEFKAARGSGTSAGSAITAEAGTEPASATVASIQHEGIDLYGNLAGTGEVEESPVVPAVHDTQDLREQAIVPVDQVLIDKIQPDPLGEVSINEDPTEPEEEVAVNADQSDLVKKNSVNENQSHLVEEVSIPEDQSFSEEGVSINENKPESVEVGSNSENPDESFGESLSPENQDDQSAEEVPAEPAFDPLTGLALDTGNIGLAEEFYSEVDEEDYPLPEEAGSTGEIRIAPFREEPMPENLEISFEPFHTVDYFASQGILARDDDRPGDRFSQQLKSFTQWLKAMKRVPGAPELSSGAQEERKIEEMASHSVQPPHIYTEAMAEVWEKQGNAEKARAVYQKLSLLDPSKSAYFAAKIEQLNHL